MRISVCVTFFYSLCCWFDISSSTHGQEITVDEAQISQIVEAHLANLESWRSGDMLVRITSSGSGRYFRLEDQAPDTPIVYVEGPEASSVEKGREQLFRVAFDLDKDRCFVAIRQRLESNVFDAVDNMSAPSVISQQGAYLFRDRERGILSLGTDGIIYQAKGFKYETASGALFVANAPDIRILGWGPIGNWDSEELNSRLTEIANGPISEILHVGKVTYRATYNDVGGVVGEINKFDLDIERNLPTQFWVGVEGQARFEGTARWRSVDGQYAPESSRYVHGEIIEEGSRRYVLFSEVSVDVHWFSLNKELPDDLFEEAILRDRKKIEELLSTDPFDKNKAKGNDEQE